MERLRYVAPAPRARIRETWGLIVWRKRGLKTGVVVSPELGGAFVFLGMGFVQIDSVEEAAAILEAIFSGEIVEVSAEGLGVWLARSDFLAARPDGQGARGRRSGDRRIRRAGLDGRLIRLRARPVRPRAGPGSAAFATSLRRARGRA